MRTRTESAVTSARTPAPLRRTVAVTSALAALAMASVASAQRAPAAPRACTSTNPSQLMAAPGVGGLSATIGEASGTLWVPYDSMAGRQRTVSLLEVSGIGNGTMQVQTYSVGEGTVGAQSVIATGNGAVGVYLRADRRIGFYAVPATANGVSSAITQRQIDAGPSPGAPSIASVGRNYVIAWSDGAGRLRTAVVDPQGVVQGTIRSRAWTGSVIASTGAHGGVVFVNSAPGSAARLQIARAGASTAPTNVQPAVGAGIGAMSATTSGRRALVLYVAGGSARIVRVDAANGRGAERTLGPAAGDAGAALSATAWGAFGAWTNAGGLQVVPLRDDGRSVSDAFSVGPLGRGRVGSLVLATRGNDAFAFWADPAAVRMVRVQCY